MNSQDQDSLLDQLEKTNDHLTNDKYVGVKLHINIFLMLFVVNVECDRLGVSSLDSCYVHVLMILYYTCRPIEYFFVTLTHTCSHNH